MRLTLDIDNKSKRNLEQKIAVLYRLFGLRVWFRKSASGKGYHLAVYGVPSEFYDHNFKLLCRIRANLGDDKRRVAWDRDRYDKGIPTQVLFDKKQGRDADPWIGVS